MILEISLGVAVGFISGYLLSQFLLNKEKKNLLDKVTSEEFLKQKIEDIDKKLGSNNESFSSFKDGLTTQFEEKMKTIYEATSKLNDSTSTSSKNLMDSFSKLNIAVDEKMKTMHESSEKTTMGLVEKFGEATKLMEEVKTKQGNLEEVTKQVKNLTDAIEAGGRSRGVVGENLLMKMVLQSAFGEMTSIICDEQKVLKNGKRPDVVIKMGENIGNICVDSKYIHNKYNELMQVRYSMKNPINPTPEERQLEQKALKAFQADVKQRIKDIKDIYITEETADFAILFLPTDAMYVDAGGEELWRTSFEAKVLIASPISLLHVCYMTKSLYDKAKLKDDVNKVVIGLRSLHEEFKRYSDRWTKFRDRMRLAWDATQEIETTGQKISKKFVEVCRQEVKAIDAGDSSEAEQKFIETENSDLFSTTNRNET